MCTPCVCLPSKGRPEKDGVKSCDSVSRGVGAEKEQHSSRVEPSLQALCVLIGYIPRLALSF